MPGINALLESPPAISWVEIASSSVSLRLSSFAHNYPHQSFYLIHNTGYCHHLQYECRSCQTSLDSLGPGILRTSNYDGLTNSAYFTDYLVLVQVNDSSLEIFQAHCTDRRDQYEIDVASIYKG